jgi:hypothetical protein
MTPELAAAIEQEAAREGISVRAWIANAAQHRVLIQRRARAMDEYQREYGAFTPRSVPTRAPGSIESSTQGV